MTAYTMTIHFHAGTPIATASFVPQPAEPGDIYQFGDGDTIDVRYAGKLNVVDSILLAGPKLSNQPRTPFAGDTHTIDLLEHPQLKIVDPSGEWGFTVTMAIKDGSSTNFYFLPDPELQVGSTD